MDFAAELERLKEGQLYRTTRVIAGGARPWLWYQGRRYLNLSSSNYLGLSDHPRVVAAAVDSLYDEGFNAGGSCLITGHGPAHAALEAAIARHQGTEGSLVYAAGYQTNLGVLTALASREAIIFSDALNHASLIDAARLSRARVVIYRHGDANHLEELLRGEVGGSPRLIVTDGVFSMDGDVAPLPDLLALAERYHALLVVDDAHGLGVLGERGAGLAEHFGLRGRIPVAVGTMSKALGVQGGFVAAGAPVIDYLVNRSRAFIFSSGLVAPVARAALAALEVVQSEGWRRQRVQMLAARLRQGLSAQGWQLQPTAVAGVPILAVVVGEAERALRLMERLREEGIWAAAIRPPTVPVGTSRLRLALMATHEDDAIEWALEVFGRIRSEWDQGEGR